MASAINKCPVCGNAFSITADVPCRIHVTPDGKAEMTTEAKVIVRSIKNIVSRGYPYHPEVKCDKCDAELKVDIDNNGSFIVSTIKEFF